MGWGLAGSRSSGADCGAARSSAAEGTGSSGRATGAAAGLVGSRGVAGWLSWELEDSEATSLAWHRC